MKRRQQRRMKKKKKLPFIRAKNLVRWCQLVQNLNTHRGAGWACISLLYHPHDLIIPRKGTTGFPDFNLVLLHLTNENEKVLPGSHLPWLGTEFSK